MNKHTKVEEELGKHVNGEQAVGGNVVVGETHNLKVLVSRGTPKANNLQ